MLDQIYVLPILLFSVVIHELAHGWMALRLGDSTAKEMGRLTFNPIPHIDPVGSVLVPLLSIIASGRVMIAWAKPVPVNPNNFVHYRRDDILVSIVGPVSNILLALCCTVMVIILAAVNPLVENSGGVMKEVFLFLINMFAAGITLNIVLAVFNMIPIPPLDGSHVVASLLPPELSLKYRRVGFFGIILLLVIMRWEPVNTAYGRIIETLSYPFQQMIHFFIR